MRPMIKPIIIKIFEYAAALRCASSLLITEDSLISAMKYRENPMEKVPSMPFIAPVRPKYCNPSQSVARIKKIHTQLEPNNANIIAKEPEVNARVLPSFSKNFCSISLLLPASESFGFCSNRDRFLKK